MPHLEIKADLDNLKPVRDYISENAQLAGLPIERIGDLLLAVDEAITNIITHGCSDSERTITIDMQTDCDPLVVRIVDNCEQFDPTTVDAPDLNAPPLERTQPGGYGIYLLKNLVDRVTYQTLTDGQNELTLFVQCR